MDESSLVKKMARLEKRKALKRKNTDKEDQSSELPQEKKVDKAQIREQIKTREYDMTVHFSKKSVLEVQTGYKVKSFALIP